MTPLRIVAHLAAPLAGDAPQLDTLLEYALCHRQAMPTRLPDGTHMRLRRELPMPRLEEREVDFTRRWQAATDEMAGTLASRMYRTFRGTGGVAIPLLRRGLGGWSIACASMPIVAEPGKAQGVEYINKRLGVEHAPLLAPESRLVVSTTNSWTKSYRLPLRIRRVDRVAWFAVGNRREIHKVLAREVRAVGKKVADGYGVVGRWEVEEVREDHSWFARHPSGVVLMQTLPRCRELPADLLGWRPGFAAVVGPRWHPDRTCEVVEPC